MRKTFCDCCGEETGYYEYKLDMNQPSYGHGDEVHLELCAECGEVIFNAIKDSQNKTSIDKHSKRVKEK